ncbi:MAG: chemotaxis-specific protein-glutamate methyltransferase CheB [Planctomycetota bacterium]|nr:chemotaxis-specific protein-glutamate methyltransferase CheB [Planctomycetota bacterium]
MAPIRRVLVVDDSQTTREMLSAVIEAHPELTVTGVAANGNEALAFVEKRRPDIITMDVRMPRMDGLAATKQIMSRWPTPIVIVAGAARDAEVRASIQAMELGAVAVLPKPHGPLADGFEADCRSLQETLVTLAGVSVVRRREMTRLRRRPSAPAQRPHARRVHAVAIAASTGGPQVLRRILGDLPASLSAPVLVVQHIAPGFTAGLAEHLDRHCALAVTIAEDGDRLRAGHVYVAPDDLHLGVRDHRVHLDAGPRCGRFRPAADYLFESTAKAYGSRLFAAILTGMGSDGVRGLREVKTTGGRIVAQDEASCVVFGMPGAAVHAGLTAECMPPEAIAAAIRRAVCGGETAGELPLRA